MPIDWDSYRLEIHSLYLDQGKTLNEVREILRRKHGVDAWYRDCPPLRRTTTDTTNSGLDSTRIYKKQLEKWGYRKYNSRKQVHSGDQGQQTVRQPVATPPSDFLRSASHSPDSLGSPESPRSSPTALGLLRPYNYWDGPQAEGYSEYMDVEGRDRLHQAALEGSWKRVEGLLAEGACVNTSDNWQCQPLHYAAAGGFADIVELLVRSGAAIDAKDGGGRTPLHSAAASEAKRQRGLNVLRTMEVLLKAEPEPLSPDIDGNTALHLLLIHTDSADRIQPSYIKLLLDHGADVNLRNAAGRTPFQIALENLGLRIPPALIGIFLQHGADVGLKDRRGVLPFQGYLEKCKSFRYGHPYLKEETNAVAKAFLAYGANPDTTSQPGESLLCYLLRLGDCLRFNLDLALLVCEKADVGFQGTSGNYPLHEVTMHSIQHGTNCIKLFQLLLDRGADPNAVNHANVSPLLALFNAKGKGIDVLTMTRALLSKGADPMLRDFNGRLAIYEAAKLYRGEVRRDILRLLLSASSNPPELIESDSIPVGHEELWWQLFDISLESSRAGFPGLGLAIMRGKEPLLSVTTHAAVIQDAALTVVAEIGLDYCASEEHGRFDSALAKLCTSVCYANDFISLLQVCQDQGITVDKKYHYLLDFIE